MASSTVGMLRTNVIAPPVPQLKQRQRLPAPATTVVECSSRPQKKATAHHMKTRPKKTQPWDVKRKGPTPYPPLPTLPPDWTLVASSSAAGGGGGEEEDRRVVAAPTEAAP